VSSFNPEPKEAAEKGDWLPRSRLRRKTKKTGRAAAQFVPSPAWRERVRASGFTTKPSMWTLDGLQPVGCLSPFSAASEGERVEHLATATVAFGSGLNEYGVDVHQEVL
jgi:hypothetical protein